MNTPKNFEDFLATLHGETYFGTDDDMPDAFDSWLTDLQVDDLIKYADQFAATIRAKTLKEAEECLPKKRVNDPTENTEEIHIGFDQCRTEFLHKFRSLQAHD